MGFRIADTFTDSLDPLTGEEQKAVKTTAFDLQLNPATPGMSFHKLPKARDMDEAQDVSVPQLRFLAALGPRRRPDALFFAGDLGQRIFQPFSWKSLGVDVRGRSGIPRINYRTSHQIRTHADRLLGTELSDVTATPNRGPARSRCSTGRLRRRMCSRAPRTRRRRSAGGWPTAQPRA